MSEDEELQQLADGSFNEFIIQVDRETFVKHLDELKSLLDKPKLDILELQNKVEEMKKLFTA